MLRVKHGVRTYSERPNGQGSERDLAAVGTGRG